MDILSDLRTSLRARLDVRSAAIGRMESALSGAEARGDGAFSADETAAITEARAAIAAVDAEIESIKGRISDVESIRAARADHDAAADAVGDVRERAPGRVSVGEPDLYRAGGPHSFFKDVYGAMRGSRSAAERIERHNTYETSRTDSAMPERRAMTATTDLGVAVTPQYLLGLFAPVVHEGRPFANVMNGSQPLPDDGMTWSIPRGNTGTVMLSQTTQGTALSTRTYTNNDLTGPIITIGGYNDVTRQSLDRGMNTDRIIMEDMTGAYVDETDRQVIAGTGANNQHWGVMSTTGISTVTVSSTGAITQLRQIVTALGTLRTARKRGATALVVHPRRWAYWLQAVDTAGRPIITPTANGPFNALGRVEAGQGFESQIAGFIHNTPVILDSNIPITLSYDVTQSSTTDPVILTRASDLYLMEDSPVPTMIEAIPDARNLVVTFVGWGYQAFTAARYTSGTLVLAGSGLTTPPAVG